MRETAAEIAAFFEKWRPLLGPGDEIAINEFNDWAGKVEDRSGTPRPDPLAAGTARPPCRMLWSNLSVHADGKVSACCHDSEDELVVGDLAAATPSAGSGRASLSPASGGSTAKGASWSSRSATRAATSPDPAAGEPAAMKVVYVLNGTGLCGGVRVVFAHAAILRRLGHDVEVVSPDPPAEWAPESHAFYRQVSGLDPARIGPADVAVGTIFFTVSHCDGRPGGRPVPPLPGIRRALRAGARQVAGDRGGLRARDGEARRVAAPGRPDRPAVRQRAYWIPSRSTRTISRPPPPRGLTTGPSASSCRSSGTCP